MHDADMVAAHMLPAGLLHDKDTAAMHDASHATPSISAIKPLAQAEREIIESAIAACGGNIPQAAAALEVSPSTIYRKKTAWDAAD